MKPEKQLYQWDVNQYLTGINPAAKYVDYTIGNDVIRLETDGTRCRIPDEVLQTYGGKTTRNVYTVELETLVWKRSDVKFYAALPATAKADGYYHSTNNELCNKYESISMNDLFAGNVGIATHSITGETVWIYDNNYETPEQLVASLSGAVLHYELATPTTEPVDIPEPLQEWLPMEPGGTVTFQNADESKQLAVPNAVSWVRKLDEVK